MKGLAAFARAVDRLNDTVGRTVAWLALAMVLMQFAVVVLRYIFGFGSIFMQESIVYMHGLLFMLGAGYNLLHGGHVRVDIFYSDAPAKAKAVVDLVGVIVLLIPVSIVILIYSMPYVRASWAVFEGSKETSGIQGVFLLKSVVIIFAVLVLLQGIAMAVGAAIVLTTGERPPAPEPREGP